MKGTEERLLFSFKDLLVSVGGFLGLFIGLSLNDVITIVKHCGEYVFKRISKSNVSNVIERSKI